MLQFEGEKDFPLPVPALWAKLSDARFLIECIPDMESITHAEADQAACVVRPGFSFVRGKLDLSVRIVDKVADQSVRGEVDSKGLGTSSGVEVLLTLTAQDKGSKLHWTAAVVRQGGLLKAVPSGLVRGAANKIINDVWGIVETKLSLTKSADAQEPS